MTDLWTRSAITHGVPWHERIAAALACYALEPDTSARLVTLSENATYLVREPRTGRCRIMRLHRPGYRSIGQIESELEWMVALKESGAARVADIMRTRGGERVARLACGNGGEEQFAVLFEFLHGENPDENNLQAIAARMHEQAAQWRRPPGFTRMEMDIDYAIGPRGFWGYWGANRAIDDSLYDLLSIAEQRLRADLRQYGGQGAHFGLTHCDMRAANLIMCRRVLHVIDFDDCADTWQMYELAGFLSFREAEMDISACAGRWLNAYAAHRPLTEADLRCIPALIMTRRLLLVGWFATHGHTVEVREMGNAFVEASRTVARRYLDGSLITL
ncbi:phosphotransferase enzyme family protein [Komagataeibacter sp. FNDCF1]|uniref:phosphotransferase enzyme family protein n=1 Tax=Komagataeibacter sp. FNDCF1 TaxID=2878681 RepID=UPI001E47E554|nr:phosphotransferase [Komagataeibacter sp. FNDCF1]MCE2565256.1 phosphotransferase [Komagataeibacter sp. FNDCF1]